MQKVLVSSSNTLIWSGFNCASDGSSSDPPHETSPVSQQRSGELNPHLQLTRFRRFGATIRTASELSMRTGGEFSIATFFPGEPRSE